MKSAENNRVEDEEGAMAKKSSKGLKKMAKNVQEDITLVKSTMLSSSERRKTLYSRDALMPEHIFSDIPYSETYNALKTEDMDKLKDLMCSFVVSIATRTYSQTWESIADNKSEKKRLLRSFVYLDTLITL
jgi:hypothetical protein